MTKHKERTFTAIISSQKIYKSLNGSVAVTQGMKNNKALVCLRWATSLNCRQTSPCLIGLLVSRITLLQKLSHTTLVRESTCKSIKVCFSF